MKMNQRLLPIGFYDVLMPEADHRNQIISQLLQHFSCFGYEAVLPSLMEFAHSDTESGSGFQVMDPLSQHMMVMRSDITTQIARIATTRLSHRPTPYRLSYQGEVLRIENKGLHKTRQLTQVGIECIGEKHLCSDVEVIQIALHSLTALSCQGLSIDFNLPALVDHIISSLSLHPEEITQLKDALARKDSKATAALAGERNTLLQLLLLPCNQPDALLDTLITADIPEEGRALCEQLRTVIAEINRNFSHVTITLDLVEYYGFEYHDGISFSLFADAGDSEIKLGSGGRYQILADDHSAPHYATGVTLYIEQLLPILTPDAAKKRLLLAPDTSWETAESYRQEGWVTLTSFANEAVNTSSLIEEATTHHCAAILIDNTLQMI